MPNSLPPDVVAGTDETGYSLLFAKGKRQWLIHLWSNQVVSCALATAPPLRFEPARTYKFVLPEGAKLESKGFYSHAVASKEQRRRAVTAYARLIAARLAAGYELVADSRILDKAFKLRGRPKVLPAAKLAKLGPWETLKYWGTIHAATDDLRVTKVAATCEDTTEAAVRFAALRTLPKTQDKIVLRGDVGDKAFKGKLLWVRGDLHVKGNLELGVDLLVSGDLVVDGVIRDTREWTHLLVGGSVKAGALDVGSQLYAAGTITSEIVVIDGTGELVSGKGLRTRLLVEEGYDHHVEGKVQARCRIDFTKSAELGVAKLERVLAPKLVSVIRRELEQNGEDFYFPKHAVIDAWKARARVWRA